MWECHLCNRIFKNNHQAHFCADKTVGDFLTGKSDSSLALFDYFILRLEEIGPVKLYATKSMIVIAADTGFAYVINLGKNHIDVVLPYNEQYEDNLCFRKIAQVPGSNKYNHHLRIIYKEDINDEVFGFMKKAYANGKNV